MFHVRCQCGADSKLGVEHIGKPVACPACKKVLRPVARDWTPESDGFAHVLHVQSGPSRVGEQIFLGGRNPLEIGKRPEKDISLAGERVSRAHGQLVRTSTGWRLEDQKSRNGLFVNNHRVDAQELHNGDRIRIGEYELIYSSTTDAPPKAALAAAKSAATTDEADADDGIYAFAAEPDSPQEPRVALTVADRKQPDPVCPSCKKQLAAGAKICVQCGIDVKTGRKLLTAHDADLDQVYDRAERVIWIVSWFVWLGIYPIASEAFGTRKPHVVRALAVLTILGSVWFWAYEWTDSPRMASLKNLYLWSGEAEPIAEEVLLLCTSTHFGDPEAFQAKYNELEGTLPDEELALAAHRALAPSQQCLGRFHPWQLITHAFLHEDIFHLMGNILFLVVLGSRVNAMIGSAATVVIYPILAVAGGIAHRLSTADQPPHPMLGASGAIMGLAGMYLVLFPLHKVHMAIWMRTIFWQWLQLSLRLFAVRGFWVVLFYIAFDVVYTTFGIEDQTAHWAHLGGFLTGAAIALVLLFSRLINARGGDLVSAVLGKRAWALVGRPNDERKALLGG